MSINSENYKLTDEQLHDFILTAYRFVEDYKNLYSKIFVIEKVVKYVDDIDMTNIDEVDIFTDCLYFLIKDIYITANQIYENCKDVNITKYSEVQNG